MSISHGARRPGNERIHLQKPHLILARTGPQDFIPIQLAFDRIEWVVFEHGLCKRVIEHQPITTEERC
jgi:hypothetical protein